MNRSNSNKKLNDLNKLLKNRQFRIFEWFNLSDW